MKPRIHMVDLPWPHGWDQMQWLIAAWVSRYGERASIQMYWNEALLTEQVDAATFQAATTDFYRALQQRLGGACQWQFERKAARSGHHLVLSWVDPVQE